MGFIVVYQGAGGGSQCAEHATLQDAARFVEQLCNDHGVHAARILQAEEVPFDVRAYYRVELAAAAATATAKDEPERVARHSGVPADWVTFADRLDAIEAVESAVGAGSDTAASSDPGDLAPRPAPPVLAPALVTVPSPVRTADDSGVLRRGLFGR